MVTSVPKISYSVPQKKQSNTGLKRHDGEQIIIDFFFLGGSTMPLRLHSRRPEAAAEDKCKFEARAGERE